MEKTLKYVLVGFLAFLALGLLVFMIFAMSKKDWFFSFFTEESHLVLEKDYDVSTFDTIKILSTYSDVRVLNHEASSVKVLIYSSNDQATSEINKQTLEINKNDRKYGCFGFCSHKEEIVVYLPYDFNKDLFIHTVSGEVDVENFSSLDVEVKTTSGDISVNHASKVSIESISGEVFIGTVLDVLLKTVSGDINIHSINKTIQAATTSGEVLIDFLTLEAESFIETVSGDVEIREGTRIYVDAKSTSGNLEIHSQDSSFIPLKIKTISGDILVG